MFRLALLAASVAVVLGRRSPNADLALEVVKHGSGSYSNSVIEDSQLDVPGLITKYGYPLEIHEVTTEDGYILTMYRIPHGRDRNNRPDSSKTVVFLLHGLTSSCSDFLVLGPGNALAYLLAEEGYDIWLGNARGNFYSRHHVFLNPDNKLNQDFWKFSWDEIGNFDLPACLNYIEKVTGQSKLHYVGHSQGGTAFLVLNSLRPEYNEKFISFQGLAPASYFTYNKNPIFNSLAPFESILEPAAYAMGIGEVFDSTDFLSWFAQHFCNEKTMVEPLCGARSISESSDNINQTMIPVFRGQAPAGASVREFAHYGQCIRFDTFRRYNYDALTNIIKYGSMVPPEYNLSLITAPSYIQYAKSDELVYPKDAEKLASKIGNLKVLKLVGLDSFGHIDFIWGKRVKELVYNDVLKMMRDAENDLE